MNRLRESYLQTYTFRRGDFFPEFLNFVSAEFSHVLRHDFISSGNVFNFLCTRPDKMKKALLDFAKKNLDNLTAIREALIIAKLLGIHLELEEEDRKILDDSLSREMIEGMVSLSEEISNLNPYVYRDGKFAAPSLHEDKKITFVAMEIEGKIPTSAPHTTEFDTLTYSQIVSVFNSRAFTFLGRAQVKNLCQALSNAYIKTRFPEAEPCNVEFAKFERSKNGNTTFGAYFTGLGEIVMNDDMFEMFSSSTERLAPFLFETIIHESKHRVQYQLGTIGQKTEADKIVASEIFGTLKPSQSTLSYNQYLCEIEELDARNAAFGELQYIHDNGTMSDAMEKHFKERREMEERRAVEYEKILSTDQVERNRRLFPNLYSSSSTFSESGK